MLSLLLSKFNLKPLLKSQLLLLPLKPHLSKFIGLGLFQRLVFILKIGAPLLVFFQKGECGSIGSVGAILIVIIIGRIVLFLKSLERLMWELKGLLGLRQQTYFFCFMVVGTWTGW